ncbi:MAG: hypothetical protein DWI22_00115 [Planctomycetota bacterium]|nr:MAG: hypothetical protein DWI22_00115 [Planctomycetota bacterium]
MNPILHPIFALLASVTRQDLARQVAYLKEEHKMLRAAGATPGFSGNSGSVESKASPAKR